ncbi:OmpH family outer membrane protein [Deinococcus hohokamensis]|uniref:OmpH family outer membrane protein n=1 Tax=Deinococcus hohokamensis TaxID=309883 RepID=A0ABV9ICM0_9DEIO
MNRPLIVLPLALLAFGLSTAQPHAQQAKSRVAFVNVQAAVKAMPGSAAYLQVVTKTDADLKKKQTNLQGLATKANASKKAADRQALLTAQQAYTKAQAEYARQVDSAFKPLAGKLNTAIARVAKANGYSVVFDQRVAAQTGLVVYANDSATNLTNAVIKALK